MAKRTTRNKRPPKDEVDDVVEIPLCEAPGCTSPALDEGGFCLVHLGLDMALNKLQSSMKKNDVTGALMGGVGLLLFNPQTSAAFGAAAQRFMPGGTVPPPPPPPRSPNPPPPRGRDPWSFLGLDPNKASADDVKRVQRALAKLYHSDTGPGGVDPGRMAAVNAAAAACLEQLKRRGK